MRIPSYDDLTPSIPDVDPGDVLGSVAVVLPRGGPVVTPQVATSSGTQHLFAALAPLEPGGWPADAVRRMTVRPADGLRRALDAPSPRTNPEFPSPRSEPRAPGPCGLFAIARDFSPRIERHPGGDLVLDVAGLQRLLGDAAAIAQELLRAGAPRVAVAATQTAAMLLARAGAGATVATGDPEAALRDVPIAVLQQFLYDRRTVRPARATPARAASADPDERAFDALRRWGLTTIGEFAALPAAELSARLGSGGLAIQRLARGLDPRPLVPDPGVPRFIESFELEWPLDTLEPLSFVFARLLEPLSAALDRADRGAVALRLTLRLTDRTTHVRTVPLPVAMRDPRVLRTLLLLDLESHPPSAAVDVVTLELDPAPARIIQYSLLERAVPSSESLATLMARLGALVGDTRCGSPALIDSHRPGGCSLQPVRFGDTGRGHAPPSTPPDRPDQAPPFVLRRFRPPVAIRVAVEAGRPVRVAIDRRGMPGGEVREAAGPWRSSGAWWNADRWNRDEWDVAFADGVVCRLFRDRDSGLWFMDGVGD